MSKSARDEGIDRLAREEEGVLREIESVLSLLFILPYSLLTFSFWFLKRRTLDKAHETLTILLALSTSSPPSAPPPPQPSIPNPSTIPPRLKVLPTSLASPSASSQREGGAGGTSSRANSQGPRSSPAPGSAYGTPKAGESRKRERGGKEKGGEKGGVVLEKGRRVAFYQEADESWLLFRVVSANVTEKGCVKVPILPFFLAFVLFFGFGTVPNASREGGTDASFVRLFTQNDLPNPRRRPRRVRSSTSTVCPFPLPSLQPI